jgi:excisionase family DNA binding protein
MTSPSPKPTPHHDVRDAPLLDIPAVARRLDVCEKTVRRFIPRGELHAYRIGRQLRIREEDLLSFLELRK